LDRIRSLSEQLLHRYPEAFSSDFEKNKKVLEDLTIISSKQLRNHVAGYIARSLREETGTEETAQEVKEA
jgi:small subunit ribosomal protein S17e